MTTDQPAFEAKNLTANRVPSGDLFGSVVRPLAHKSGIGLMIGLLVHQGAMCSKCGHGTRATSKRWAVCKKCGERVERRALPNVEISHGGTPASKTLL